MNRRRRIRRRTAVRGGRKIEMNFVPIIVIICLSVCAGYLTAKYVIYPILGYEPAALNIFQEKTEKKTAADTAGDAAGKTGSTEGTGAAGGEEGTAGQNGGAARQTEKADQNTAQQETAAQPKVVEDQANVTRVSGYALQFGSYSTKGAADKSVQDLKSSGIDARVIEKDNAYKVIGELFKTKDEARAALAKLDASVGAFVATIDQQTVGQQM